MRLPPDASGIITKYTVTTIPLHFVNSSLSLRQKRQTNIGADVMRCLNFLQMNATVIVGADGNVTMIKVTGLGKLTCV